MEHVRDIILKILESPALYIGTIAVLYILLKKGLISVNTSVVQIGRTRDNERRIIGAQINYLSLHLGVIASYLEKRFPDTNHYHIKYVVELIHDECVRRCAVNHITSDSIYLEEVYYTILDIVRKRASLDYFWSKDFEEFTKKEVEEMLTHLMMIRNRMSK